MWSSERLEALLAVVEEGSFQAAARKLHLTQSAVSQRLAALEEEVGSPLVARAAPISTTAIGMRIIQHAAQVRALERDLRAELGQELQSAVARVIIAVNADSVATWFLEAVQGFLRDQMKQRSLTLVELRIANEERTHEMVRRGEALACVTAAEVSLAGCERVRLGSMRYVAAATRGFVKKFFPRGLNRESVARAPCVLFDSHDGMHDRFLRKIIPGELPEYPAHYVPTSDGFTDLILKGLAYGVVGELQAPQALKARKLVRLAPGTDISVPLYWYYPRNESAEQRKLRSVLTAAASRALA